MVQKVALIELSTLPPLFPFPEGYLPKEELLRKELYPPIPLWYRGHKEGDRIVWGKGLVNRLIELNVQDVLVRRFGTGELTISEALILWMELEHKKEGWNSYRAEEFSQLPIPLQQFVAEDKIDLKTALRVKTLPLEILNHVIPFLDNRSFSERRIFLQLLYEILQRDRLDTKKGVELARHLTHLAKPLEELYRIRYPELHRLEETYHGTVDSVLKGTGIKVSPPPNFEGTRFKVEFSFEKGSQLKRKALVLQKLSEMIDPVIEHVTYGSK